MYVGRRTLIKRIYVGVITGGRTALALILMLISGLSVNISLS
jgi:hypothetical protein